MVLHFETRIITERFMFHQTFDGPLYRRDPVFCAVGVSGQHNAKRFCTSITLLMLNPMWRRPGRPRLASSVTGSLFYARYSTFTKAREAVANFHTVECDFWDQ